MKDNVIEIKNLSKRYFLGKISSGTLYRDISSVWSKLRNKKDPNSKIVSTKEVNTKKEEKIWALKNINLKIEKGDILGVIGKNGAGKSTLLKILSRITSPTEGEIKIYGKIASLLEVGTGFHPELTGKENIFLNGAILGMTFNHIEKKIDEIIEFSGIRTYIETPIKRYSTGMKVRLGFSIAAFLDADILFVDEVLAVGDAEFREKALNKMNELSNNQMKTIIFVSHNLNAILSLTKKCIYLKEGEIVSQGNTKDLIQKYLNDQEDIAEVNFPINNVISFEDIYLTNANGIRKASFFYDENIIIHYNYRLLKRCPKLRIAFNISDTFGTILFNSADFPDGNRSKENIEVGKYVATAIIPKCFFNEGRLYLGVTSDIPFVKTYLDQRKIFSLSINFRTVKTADIKEKFEGPFFPEIVWETYRNEKK